jgi:hypothetical protein
MSGPDFIDAGSVNPRSARNGCGFPHRASAPWPETQIS